MVSSDDALDITVIGIGYLGLTHAVCMADIGHNVLAIDVDDVKVAKAARGETPFYEPGLEPLLRKNLEAGRLRFTRSFAEIGEFGDVHFVCVGTPQAKGSTGADLTYVQGAVDSLAPYLTRETLIIGKSTVPVGTTRKLLPRVRSAAPAGDHVHIAFNPEFLREGHAVQDSLTPDRIVFGVTDEESERLMRRVYAAALAEGIPSLTMDLETAELVKVAANSFLATKISYINVMAEVCEASGADVTKLARAIGLDERIGGKFLAAGLGFGGGCLPKDIRAFRATAGELGIGSLVTWLATVDEINLGRRERVMDLTRQAAGGDLSGKRVAVLGIAFKPSSDDIRDSPALAVTRRMCEEGAVVSAYDPIANANAARQVTDVNFVDSVSDAIERADVVLHLTEWGEFQALDPASIKGTVTHPVLVDARCALDTDLWRSAGWTFYAPGRP
ncbi:MAG TPA: UDP-glucose/GDP-mannose dehydrogenase family protein [Trebonia sp.]|nr:UDP-glucose/GDP-mannose dehydrogenase family protein [Trebonia sp.]